MNSNVSTPLLEPQTSLAPPSPSPAALAHATATRASSSSSSSSAGKGGNKNAHPPKHHNGNGDIPPLSLDILTERDDRVDALRLVADSIAQQRQSASLTLVFHPLCLTVLVAALALAHHHAWHRMDRDLGLELTLCSGVVMTYLLAIRYATSAYIRLAEEVGWGFLSPSGFGDGTDLSAEDIVVGTCFGGQIIGTLVLRLEPNSPSSSSSMPPSSSGQTSAVGEGGGGRSSGRRKNRTSSLKGGRGVIRAWTTKLRYRRRGVGVDMLHEAVRITRERCGRDAQVGFAREHANSAMVLPELFNKPFRRTEMRAARTLEGVLADWEGSRRKR